MAIEGKQTHGKQSQSQMQTGGTIDYRECEKEPITTMGEIQSYGGLIIMQNGNVIAHSKNIHLFLPLAPSYFLHQKVSTVLPEIFELYKNNLSQIELGRTLFQIFGQWIVGFRKSEDELVYVEFFPQPTHSFDLVGL